jgi:alanine racemase
MFSVLKFFNKEYEHLVKVNIYEQNIVHNLNTFKSVAPAWGIAPVLKSNGYGHGLEEMVSILDKESIDFYCVDSLFEASRIRKLTSRDILIMGYTPINNILSFKYRNVMYSIGSMYELSELADKLNSKQIFHLKFNTGMNRRGLDMGEIRQVFELLDKNPNIIIDGVFSHFADADNENEKESLKQIEKWNSLVNTFKIKYPNIQKYHMSATSGVKFYNKINASHLRLGLGIYGFDPNNKIDLMPAMEIVSKISQIRKIKNGDGVGYNFTFIADKDMTIATLPFGYYEGFWRDLSNVGYVKIRDVFCPIIGRVSMNVVCVDVSYVSDISMDDCATLISKDKNDKNNILNIAKDCGTIPYEILVKINGDLKRNIL